MPRHRLLALTRTASGTCADADRLVLESLIPTILEQKVTTGEAYGPGGCWLRKYGEPAPGPRRTDVGDAGTPDVGADSLLGVASGRTTTSGRRRFCGRCGSLRGWRRRWGCLLPRRRRGWSWCGDRGVDVGGDGVQRSHGAVDAVTVGDLHLPGIVGWALAGTVRG
ncbi:hypothetical protein GCM10023238_16800 [Streptomyces heliomycini]